MDKTTKTKNWSNDLVGKICFLDKTGLEDAITFQDVDFESIDGYYFDEGFNTKIKEQIKVIFDKRLEAKAAGNDGLQQAYKLLMNSSYGKLIEKTLVQIINASNYWSASPQYEMKTKHKNSKMS